ncbi:MAG: succinylglutamate desuccinylase/aspartoacylase family protein, partial [Armatimonadetes bacterium]|nr:succinylglutamate desuccinylase/aspartoacylase family protein [Armatimonadota bacterium]
AGGGLSRTLAALLLLAAAAQALPPLSYSPGPDEAVRFVVAAAAQHAFVQPASIGRSAQGRDIPVITLRDPRVPALEVPRILVLCRQHGNEPAGTVAMLGMIADLAEGRMGQLEEWLQHVCVQIVPYVNPDGAAADRRHNARDVDLNRDWVLRTQPETRAVEYLVGLWRPDCVLDLHELHPNDAVGLNTVEAPNEGVLGQLVGGESRRLQWFILDRLQPWGFPLRPSYWDAASHPGLCHRHFAREEQRTSLLFESEREGNRTQLPRRAQFHRFGVLAAVEYYATRGAAPLPFILPRTPPTGGREGYEDSVAVRPSAPAHRAAPEPRIVVVSPDLQQPVAQGARLVARLDGVPDFSYASVRIDGQGRYFSNKPAVDYDLRAAELGEGRHVLLIQVHREDGSVLEHEQVFSVALGGGQ